MKYYLLLIWFSLLTTFCLAENTNSFELAKIKPIEQGIKSRTEDLDIEDITSLAINEAEGNIAAGEDAWFEGVDYSEDWAAGGFTQPSPVDETSKANALYEWVKKENRIIQLFEPSRKYNLPVGIVANVAGVEFIVIIDSLVYTPRGAEMTTYMSMEIPFSENRIAFKGENIKFNASGIHGAKMKALKDYVINISSQTQLIIKQSDSYIEFDCNGYKETTISAEVSVDRRLLVPLDASGAIIAAPKKVAATFTTTFYDWNDLIMEINFTPFQITGLDGFKFKVEKAVIDLSDYKNAEGMVFPQGYSSPGMSGSSTMWRGFYLKKLEITLPKDFGKDIKLLAENMLVDEMGVSGVFSGVNLIPLNEGNLQGWDFSIERLSASIVANKVNKIEFNGEIKVPLEDESRTGFKYRGSISNEGDYLLDVSLTSRLNMDLWLAELKLDKGSNIIIEKIKGELRPKAVLSGTMNIGAKGDTKLQVGIKFEELTIQTVSPKLGIKAVSFGDDTQANFKGFPIMINKMSFVNKPDKTSGLAFNVVLNFMDGETGFGANGGFTIWGEEYTKSEKTRWRYKSIQVNSFGVDIKTVAFTFKGSLTIYDDDATYGNGFKGTIDAWFKPGISVSAAAQFGSVSGFRYWYVDATVSFPTGIMVYPAFAIYGFGGGAYYHMKQTNLPTKISNSGSRVDYTPNRSIGLGIKAMVIVGTYPKPEAFNGDASFEIAFNATGGLSSIEFKGNAYFLKTLDPNKDWTTGNNSPFGASLYVKYDFNNSILYGNFRVFMNIAGVIKGTGAGNVAGYIEMYFSKQDWYINIGTPSNRVGVKIISLLNVDAYFMVGTNIPNMPDLPANVKRILNINDFNHNRDNNLLNTGKGFAFGASASFDTGDITFLIFYARLAAGVGFDFMLKNYGPDAHCNGRSGTLGIDGWYSSGQVYAWVEAAIGIKVNLFGIKKKFPIIDLKAAAVFQARLPNPTWVAGTVGGSYSILGGLIKGKCKFDFEVGEKCDFDGGSVVGGITVISELSPFNGSKDVSVFTNPQVAFNMQLNYEFQLLEWDGSKKSYIIKLDHFKVMCDNNQINGEYKWNEDGLVCLFSSHEILPPNKEIYLEASVHFEVKENGRWQTVMQNGKVATEVMSSRFTTGTAPDNIPESNVRYAYPFNGQKYFYPDENYNGYIVLDKGQSYLFESFNGWEQAAIIRAGGKYKFGFNYDAGAKTVYFRLPGGIKTDKDASFSLAHIAPGQNNAAIDSNVKDKVDHRSDAEIVTTQDIEGTIVQTMDKEIYSCNFKTSKYPTLQAKLNSYSKQSTFSRIGNEAAIFDLLLILTGNEQFSTQEILGGNNYQPLIQLTALTDNKWLKDNVIPNVYSGLDANGFWLSWRTPAGLGVPPLNAISLMNDNKTIKYYLPYVMARDQIEFRTIAAQKLVNGQINPFIKKLAESSIFLTLVDSKYNFQVKYVLPGTNKVSSTSTLGINY